MSPGLDRREFLTRGVLGRVTALLAAAGASAPVETRADPSPAPGDVAARDLRMMSRDQVRAALSRIRARWRAR